MQETDAVTGEQEHLGGRDGGVGAKVSSTLILGGYLVILLYKVLFHTFVLNLVLFHAEFIPGGTHAGTIPWQQQQQHEQQLHLRQF